MVCLCCFCYDCYASFWKPMDCYYCYFSLLTMTTTIDWHPYYCSLPPKPSSPLSSTQTNFFIQPSLVMSSWCHPYPLRLFLYYHHFIKNPTFLLKNAMSSMYLYCRAFIIWESYMLVLRKARSNLLGILLAQCSNVSVCFSHSLATCEGPSCSDISSWYVKKIVSFSKNNSSPVAGQPLPCLTTHSPPLSHTLASTTQSSHIAQPHWQRHSFEHQTHNNLFLAV